MKGRFDRIDLESLPPPDVVVLPDFETLLARSKKRARNLFAQTGIMEDWDDSLLSDKVVKLLEEKTYSDLILLQRVNEAARAVMLPTAKGSDLDHLAALYHVRRQIVSAATPDAIPPVPAVMESDAALRDRVLLAFDALSVAGPEGAYIYHAVSTSPDVAGVDVSSPDPGVVEVTILSHSGGGIPNAGLLEKVRNVLTAKDVRPLTDHVTVKAAEKIDFRLVVKLDLYGGPDKAVVFVTAKENLSRFLAAQRRLGEPVTVDGVHKATRADGVRKVRLFKGDGKTAFVDIVPEHNRFANCTNTVILEDDGQGGGA